MSERNYYDDLIDAEAILNGEPASHPHRRISDAEVHLHHRESDRRLAVLEQGQLRQQSSLEAIADRIVASVGENTRSTDHLRREVGTAFQSVGRYLWYQLILAVVALVVAAGLAGASIYVKAAGVEVSSAPVAQPPDPTPAP